MDRWIAEAKQLRADVQDSQAHAEQIQRIAFKGSSLRNEALDVRNKAAFLRRELVFHQSLGTTLTKIQQLWTTVEQAQDTTVFYRLKEAVELLQRSQQLLSELSECRRTALLGLLQARIADIWRSLLNSACIIFNKIAIVNREKSSIRIMSTTRGTVPWLKHAERV